MDVKKLEAEVTAKLQMLEYTHTKSKAIVGRNNTEAVGKNCQRKHHSSICDKASEKLLTATDVK